MFIYWNILTNSDRFWQIQIDVNEKIWKMKCTWSDVVKPRIVSPPIIAIPLSPSGCKITAYQITIVPITLVIKHYYNILHT